MKYKNFTIRVPESFKAQIDKAEIDFLALIMKTPSGEPIIIESDRYLSEYIADKVKLLASKLTKNVVRIA